tara:strand:- start:22 stop:543 length:522 start_codon:yes stop_codon:yes gene_type:complete
MTSITKKITTSPSDDNDPEISKDRIIDALRANNKIDTNRLNELARMNRKISSFIRAFGESHQRIEDVSVDQTTRVINHITEEIKRQINEAMNKYSTSLDNLPDQLNKILTALENNNELITKNSNIVKNRMRYGELADLNDELVEQDLKADTEKDSNVEFNIEKREKEDPYFGF